MPAVTEAWYPQPAQTRKMLQLGHDLWTPGTTKTIRPAQLEKVFPTPFLSGEPSVELPQIQRIGFHSLIVPIVATGVKHIPS